MIVINRGIIWFLALLLCAAFWAAVIYPLVAHSQPAPTPVTGSASVSDAAYGNDWNGDTENAPSKNAVFDKIETISAGGGSVTINTTSPMTGAGTGSTFTLGVNQSLMSLSSIGGAVTDSQVPDDITITALTGKQNISSLETDVEAIADLQDLQGAVTDAQVPNTITVDLASEASALASNPNDCASNQFATTIAANGNLTCAQPSFSDLSGSITDAQVPNNITVDLAATATALATNPTACGAGDFVNDIAADGTLTCGTPSGGGGVGVGTVNPGAVGAIPRYVGSTTLDDSASMFELNGNIGLGTTNPAGALAILSGNVGIGTYSPGSALTIRGQTGIALGSNSAAPPGGIIMSGNIGIGTTSTSISNLEVRSSNTSAQFRATNTSSQSTGAGSGLIAAQDDGTAMTSGNRVGFLVFSGSANTTHSMVNGAAISAYARGTLSTSSAPMMMIFQTAPSGSTTRGDRLTVDENGNIGIGTNFPRSGLSIMNGNVGIGTTSALAMFSAGSTSQFQVDNTGAIAASTGIATSGGYTQSGSTANTFTGTSTFSNATSIVATGKVGLGTTAPVGALAVMNGNVGIGTWSPTAILQVVGTIAATSFTGDGSGLTGVAVASGWTDGGTNVYTSTTTDNVGIGTTTPKTGFALDVRGSQYVSGNVGIGTVTAPGVPLYVAGPIKTSEIQGTSAPGTPFTITQANIGIGTTVAGAAVVIGNSPSHTSTGLCFGTGGCVGYCSGGLAAVCGTCTCLTTQ